VVQYAHVLAGLLWVGGGFYSILVQAPAVGAIPPAMRGAAVAQLGPRQVFYLLRLGELTILTGFLRVVVSGRGSEFSSLESRWATSLLIGIVLTVVLLVIGHAVLKPNLKRMLSLGPKAGQGDQAAAQEMAKVQDRLKTVGFVQIALGLVIIGTMVLARFS